LPPGSASRLEITLPEWSSAPFEVAIELRRTNGTVAGQTKAWIAVPPPGGSDSTGPATDQTAAKDLLAQGNRLVERGEIVAARSVYQRAAEMGSGEAALALGSTYDPNRLWSLGALGMVGSKDRARHWYARADELGHTEAKGRLRLLGN
jgi:TPR repeat protein